MRGVYLDYTEAVSRIYQSKGRQVNRLASLTTASKFARDKKAVQSFAASGAHLVGLAKVAAFHAQSIDLKSGAARIYVCLDVASTRVEDPSGKDVTPKDRPDKQALVIGFVAGPLIDTSESWTGPDVC